jgi:hypothetical protein
VTSSLWLSQDRDRQIFRAIEPSVPAVRGVFSRSIENGAWVECAAALRGNGRSGREINGSIAARRLLAMKKGTPPSLSD